jgi:ferredoxin
MKIFVDETKCQGHSRCYLTAPELFEIDDYGQSHPKITEDIPAELEEKAKLACENCPEFAITIDD